MKKEIKENWEKEFREVFGEFVIEKNGKIVASEESVIDFIRQLLEREEANWMNGYNEGFNQAMRDVIEIVNPPKQ